MSLLFQVIRVLPITGLILTAMAVAASPTYLSGKNVLAYVDPFIGTGGVGHTFPGAAFPFGSIQLSPDTGNGDWDHCSGYQYGDKTVLGFSHNHISGGGIADLGDVRMLPFMDKAVLQPAPWDAHQVEHSKEEEAASAGYYTTMLTADQIRVELSATEHTGIHQYTFTKGGEAQVLIDIDRILFSWGNPDTRRTWDNEFEIEGPFRVNGSYRSRMKVGRQVFFALKFDRAVVKSHFLEGFENRKLVVSFGDLEPGAVVRARCGISTVSIEGAKLNLAAESLGRSFGDIRASAEAAWERLLARAYVEGTEAQKKLFYTGLYRLYIQPNNIADVDGRYLGADRKVHSTESGDLYSTIALWDIYRGGFPLYTILTPEKVSDFVNSLLAHYDEMGYLPVWPLWGVDSHIMIGNHSVSLLTEAVLKGFDVDAEHAFAAVKATLTENHWRKYDWNLYDKYGYLPSDNVHSEAVSCTLEAAYNDYCAARLAMHLGKDDDYAFFAQRSRNYRNLYDTESGFMRGRNAAGDWVRPFDPMKIFHAGTAPGDYTEGNAWHYLWSVQHDISDFINLLGGAETAEKRLDQLFQLPPSIEGDGSTHDVSGLIGQYVQGNEPTQHVIYIYNYVGRPGKTQERIREVLTTMFEPTPGGLCGNDDFGQMGAWYVLSSLGFYPVNPVSGEFDIGVPAFPYARLDVSGKRFVIRAENFGVENPYVGRVLLNGNEIEDFKVSYKEIMAGGELVFEMTSTPGY